jgi:hypothetical protein
MSVTNPQGAYADIDEWRSLLRWFRHISPAQNVYESVPGPSNRYNCLSRVLGDKNRWLSSSCLLNSEPLTDETKSIYTTADAFFATRGYQRDSTLTTAISPGYSRIGLYFKDAKTSPHVALQTGEDRWLSKLGQLGELQHGLMDLKGRDYGNPAVTYSRHWLNSGNQLSAELVKQHGLFAFRLPR